nr:uncharacterized protein LOC127328361 [Lolium perenne]
MANGAQESSPTLPEDTIVMEILPYLPAKSVGRFRAVSRAWRAALSSATFIELHLRRANRDGQPRLFFCAIITTPVRGLHLVRSNNAGYYVYNPCIGSSLLLPDSAAPLKMSRRYETSTQPQPPCFFDVSYGLGYCSVTAEYKVVRLFSDSYDGGPPCCEVYVLDKPAYWRPAAQQPSVCIVSEGDSGVFLCGYLHFLSVDDGGIVTFSVSDETFGLLLPPPPPPYPEDDSVHMVELHGRLCVCYDGDLYCIWMLGDRRWEQLCCIDLMVWTEPARMPANANWISPLHMFNDDNAGHQKIMFGTGNRKVLAVDADGAGTVETIFRADDAGSFAGCAHPSLGLFQESLVPVGRTVEEIVFSSPAKQAWFHILKWMPARSVADLSLVCREWRAMIMTERFKRSHIIHANLNKSPRIMIIISPDKRCIDLENFIVLARTPPTYSNGKICWLVDPNLGPASPNCEIVAFDVHSEEFEVLQGPQCSHPVRLMSILCLQGALCVACSNLSVTVIDIWMMKDNTGTWLREYRIDLREFSPEYSSEETTPLGIDPTDGRILLSTGRSLGYYDPKTAALETIYSLGIEEYDEFSPIICDESLVFTFGPA